MVDSGVLGRSVTARAVAAAGVAGSMLPWPEVPLEEAAWRRLLVEIRGERITGLAWFAVKAGLLPATREQVDELEWMQVGSQSGCLVLERLLLDTVDRLSSAGLESRVLKGAAAAQLDYPDPTMRGFGDVDLIVRAGDFDAAVGILTGLGYRRSYPEPRPGFDRRFSKGASFRTQDDLEVDLHRTLTMGPFGVRLDLDALWQEHEKFDLAGRPIRALGPEARLLHACYHAVLGETVPRLSALRDAAQLALCRDLDLGRLHGLIRASRGEAVVATALRHVWQMFDIADVTALSAWAHAYRADPREAADLAAYGDGSSYTTKSLAALRSLPTVRDRTAFLFALLLPNAAYLDGRHDGRLPRLRTALQQRTREGGRR